MWNVYEIELDANGYGPYDEAGETPLVLWKQWLRLSDAEKKVFHDQSAVLCSSRLFFSFLFFSFLFFSLAFLTWFVNPRPSADLFLGTSKGILKGF